MSATTKKPVCVDSLKILGDFWTMMIIDKLSDGPLRFRDLEHQIEGVNTATLTTRLKSMQAFNLIERKEQSRADVTYELTVMGQKAVPILDAVNDFSAFAKKQMTN
ncbi:MAG TPA: helix-turn-helix domain-containing protein [Candidatus Saccharimonadales bacterium]|nr:helix-turn-helix domain-containing protein [Candidatus Saccharimonadales bacterium]